MPSAVAVTFLLHDELRAKRRTACYDLSVCLSVCPFVHMTVGRTRIRMSGHKNVLESGETKTNGQNYGRRLTGGGQLVYRNPSWSY